ncbi:ADP-ribose pyrophosphatase NudF [Clostridium aceticum]|uniref:ADP-ribose pyrophosphatase NudF n=1 Tax=Clostridium aceticum TaxID=84022 RepID=A0A0D8ICW9_9CLOT|nr:NUDIX hydrolase [Clostridium aceticum]AKL95319.1 ADP-ribose pyrophosphatase NudF [Clostridium aceticum]KJF28160.1 ADP-ribose pyrophosphatase [Clostridium aceticum]
MSFEEKTLKSERIYEGKVVNLRVDTVELPQKKYSKREIVEHAGAVGILAVTEDQKIVLVKQFRKPIEETILEIPAGKLEAKENPAECAIRELSEETGYTTAKVKKLLEFYSSPGFTNEILHIYLAEDLQEGVAHPDEGEYVETLHMSLDDALEKIAKGEIKDAKTVIAVLAYKNMLNMI